MRPFAIFLILVPALTSQVVAAVVVGCDVAEATPDSLVLAWTFEMEPGWHLYGPFMNDTGYPPRVELGLPTNWSAGPLEGWPVPQRHVVADLILDHIHEHRLSLRQVVRPAADATSTEIIASISWLACENICVPGDTTLTLQLPADATPAGRQTLASIAAQEPAPLAQHLYQWQRRGQVFEIRVPDARDLQFIPWSENPALVELVATGASATSSLTLTVDSSTHLEQTISGLLVFTDHNNVQHQGTIVIPPSPASGGKP